MTSRGVLEDKAWGKWGIEVVGGGEMGVGGWLVAVRCRYCVGYVTGGDA